MLASISGGAAGLNALRYGLAVNTLSDMLRASASALALADGWADEFEDSTGIDAAASTGETYDAAGDYYHNPGAYSGQALTGGTASSSAGTAGNALDGNTGSYWNPGNYNVRWEYDFGGSPVALRRGTITPYSSQNVIGKWLYWDGAAWQDVPGSDFNATGSGGTTTSWASVGARAKWALVITGGTTGSNYSIAEIAAATYTAPAALSLVSETIVADAAPGAGYGLLLVEEVDTLTANTDVSLEFSADDGATYAVVSLEDLGTVDFGAVTCRIFAGAGAFGGTGTDLRYKAGLAAGKEARIHGVWVQWS